MKPIARLTLFSAGAIAGSLICLLLLSQSLNAQGARQIASKTPTGAIEPYLKDADPSLLRSYADECIANGEIEKAIKYSKRAVELQPGNPTNHASLAQALTQKFHQDGSSDFDLHQEAFLEWKNVMATGDSFERDEALQQLGQLGLDKLKLRVKTKSRSRSVTGRIFLQRKDADQ